jgi:Tol biopolymer transport system component
MFGFLRKNPLRIPRLRAAVALVAFTTVLLLIPFVLRLAHSVGSELSQLQRQHGYRLVSMRPFDDRVYTISFADRTITPSKPFLNDGSFETGDVSPDGKRIAFSHCLAPGFTHPTPNEQDCPDGFVLATVNTDGSDLKDFPGLVNQGAPICWSHDMSKLVTNLQDRRKGGPMRFENLLVILDLKTGQTEVIEREDGPGNIFVIPQCWSPDDSQIAYTVNKPVGIRTARVYETVSKTSTDLANGGFPTWSPDGKWITYKFCPPSLRGCAYHLIRTSTGEDKVLFASDSGSALSWSPDSRFVAYASIARFYELKPSEYPLAFDFKHGVDRLRVRRLDDNAESSFVNFEAGALTWFVWVS